MIHDLAYFNHKRKTLDRVTARYSILMQREVEKFFRSQEGLLFRSLNNGSEPKFKTKEFNEALLKIARAHAVKTIEVGVSDGIQEVGTSKLQAWRGFSIDTPVEMTISLADEKKKDKIVGEQKKEIIPKNRKLLGILKATRDQQLKFLSETYKEVSKDWVKGESTIKEVKESLGSKLKSSRNSIDRLFRTETTKYFNESRHSYFKNNSNVTHMQIRTITDGRRSGICESRDKWVVPIEEASFKRNMPPFHPNCRTIQVPLNIKIPRQREMIERGLRIDERSFKPLPNGWAA